VDAAVAVVLISIYQGMRGKTPNLMIRAAASATISESQSSEIAAERSFLITDTPNGNKIYRLTGDSTPAPDGAISSQNFMPLKSNTAVPRLSRPAPTVAS